MRHACMRACFGNLMMSNVNENCEAFLALHLPINYPFLLAGIPFYCVVFGQRCHRIASLKRLV